MQETLLATFAGGCFWGVEEAFRTLPGVVSTRVGYTGGHTESPTYEKVCSDTTGHAEAVEITFDPSQISYEKLLEVFWSSHNPTELNRQGPDIGSQYRSAIFYHNEEQKTIAEKSKETLQASGKYGVSTIATEVVAAGTFYPAEEYHQKYIMKRGGGVCHV